MQTEVIIVEEFLSRMKHKHGRTIDGRRHIWDVEKLWEISKHLPVHKIKIDSIKELDQDCWFADSRSAPIPTIRNVARHCQRIINANMEYPILLCADGQLIDGGHRIAKALIEEKSEIDAVFIQLPPADVIL
ncbi:chromosome partitioning protein ParB [Paenibacillus montanisoli]|uniref:Chromosome partitioning protein ParB n=1 Tax=Paenibacillus montanisoli TaxID=2081970 RepID=A0A328U2W6_9BACL|nr:chromosome partitioning protein ParB [Paenibacillus montanisoli]RAP76422.1 chromosome partitioning protein ParB [Paenibacillus montanisoli]